MCGVVGWESDKGSTREVDQNCLLVTRPNIIHLPGLGLGRSFPSSHQRCELSIVTYKIQ